MPLGLSAWTIICFIIIFYGLFVGKYDLTAFGILLYLFGWVLRWIFRTRE